MVDPNNIKSYLIENAKPFDRDALAFCIVLILSASLVFTLQAEVYFPWTVLVFVFSISGCVFLVKSYKKYGDKTAIYFLAKALCTLFISLFMLTLSCIRIKGFLQSPLITEIQISVYIVFTLLFYALKMTQLKRTDKAPSLQKRYFMPVFIILLYLVSRFFFDTFSSVTQTMIVYFLVYFISVLLSAWSSCIPLIWYSLKYDI